MFGYTGFTVWLSEILYIIMLARAEVLVVVRLIMLFEDSLRAAK